MWVGHAGSTVREALLAAAHRDPGGVGVYLPFEGPPREEWALNAVQKEPDISPFLRPGTREAFSL
ncbi:MAG: hypothetical protein DMG05_30895 [Acidobacteria bacterium]|nr:MAG: hypothetical protein DMG05_30895 [Acidobacteriota bacterium]